ncbi:MAG TPA: ABC transporter ATP-binding protein [Acidobacteriota bacterium]|nr:ABC transporter ATP-binding protein [Acidobacteriota bacterium]
MASFPDNARPAALHVRDLCASYGARTALRRVGFTVAPGEIFGILGPSGAGKTTILAALTGTMPATGTVHYGEENLSDTKPRDRRFGNVYQEFRLFDWATVFDNVAFPCRARRWPSAQIGRRVDWALSRVHLADLADRPVRDLSGGQSQRVALARAIAFAPRALFLDEPFSDLDPPLRARLRADLVEFVAETRLPTILVTHDRGEAFAVCDRIGLLFQGILRQTGRPRELVRAPCDREAAEFLGYANAMRGELTAVDGSRVRIAISDREWHGRLSDTATELPCTGAQAVALFRPSALAPAAESPDTTNLSRLKVHAVRETEHCYLIIAAHGNDGTWTAHWPLSSPPPAPGQTITCRVDPSDLLVFPEEDGRNGLVSRGTT